MRLTEHPSIEVNLRVALLLWGEDHTRSLDETTLDFLTGCDEKSPTLARLPAPVGCDTNEIRVDWAALRHAVIASTDRNHLYFEPDLLQQHMAQLIDTCALIPGFRCCNIQVGLEILVDGRSWTGGVLDHIWHTTGWFNMMRRLLEMGDPGEVCGFVWDESCLRMVRRGDWLTLSDEHTARGFDDETPFGPWKPLTIALRAFVAQLNRTGRDLQRLCRTIRADIETRGYDPEVLGQKMVHGEHIRTRRGDMEAVATVLSQETEILPLLTSDLLFLEQFLG